MEAVVRGFVLRRLAPHASIIKQRYSEGESFEDLAAHYECGWGTIRRFLISQDVPLRSEPRKRKLDSFGVELIEAFRSGTDVSELAERFRVQPQTVRNYLLDRSALLDPVPDSDVTG
jgi:Mor family transcriptional regulator